MERRSPRGSALTVNKYRHHHSRQPRVILYSFESTELGVSHPNNKWSSLREQSMINKQSVCMIDMLEHHCSTGSRPIQNQSARMSWSRTVRAASISCTPTWLNPVEQVGRQRFFKIRAVNHCTTLSLSLETNDQKVCWFVRSFLFRDGSIDSIECLTFSFKITTVTRPSGKRYAMSAAAFDSWKGNISTF